MTAKYAWKGPCHIARMTQILPTSDYRLTSMTSPCKYDQPFSHSAYVPVTHELSVRKLSEQRSFAKLEAYMLPRTLLLLLRRRYLSS